jgi:hypothetical protein
VRARRGRGALTVVSRRVAASVAGGVVAVAALVAVAVPGTGSADSFTPVQMTVSMAPVARLHVKLPTAVTISADPGALDQRTGSLYLGVRLTSTECGGNFENTSGPTMLLRTLDPQPAAGRAYQITVRGFGRPTAYGDQTVCMYLEEAGTQRVFANDESQTVDVSQPCTAAGTSYDKAAKALARARRQLRRAKRTGQRRRLKKLVAKRRRTLRADRRRGIAACGKGVAL